jgi:hypothetical protein
MKLKKNESNTAMEFERALTAQELESYWIHQGTAFFTRWFPWKMDVAYWKARATWEYPYMWYISPTLPEGDTPTEDKVPAVLADASTDVDTDEETPTDEETA